MERGAGLSVRRGWMMGKGPWLHVLQQRVKEKIKVLLKKVQVIEYKKENASAGVRSIAEKFGCSKSQIQSILAKKDEILEHYGANKNARCKKSQIITVEKCRPGNVRVLSKGEIQEHTSNRTDVTRKNQASK